MGFCKKNTLLLLFLSFMNIGWAMECEGGEVDLGWGDCNDFFPEHSNGCMLSGCYLVEETTELSYSYINLGEFSANIGDLINLLNEICKNNEKMKLEAFQAAIRALQTRKIFWDDILFSINEKKMIASKI